MSIDKNQAMVEYLFRCDTIKENPLFFNFAQEEDATNHFVTIADDVDLQKPYIDGSVLKQYTFNVISYRSVVHNPLIDEPGFIDENMENLAKIQSVMDWIEEQSDSGEFPDFGTDCVVENMRCLTNDPNLFGVDTNVNPPLAKYSVVIRLQYLDNTKKLWKS